MATLEEIIALCHGVHPADSPVPAAVEKLVERAPLLLKAEESTWLVRVANRRLLLQALARSANHSDDGNNVRAAALDLWARYLQSTAPTPEWSRVIGFGIENIPGLLDASEHAVIQKYHAHPASMDLWARLARAAVDHAVETPPGARRTELLARAEKWCAADEQADRTRGQAAVQHARALRLQGWSKEAEARVAAAYAAHPELRDGLTHLAHQDYARGAVESALRLQAKDRDLGRQTDLSRRLHAVQLALHDRWEDALRTLPSAATIGAVAAAQHATGFVFEVAAGATTAWRRHGNTRRILALLSRLARMADEIYPPGVVGATFAYTVASLHAMAGSDRCAEAWLQRSENMAEKGSAARRADLGVLLYQGRQTGRGLTWLESAGAEVENKAAQVTTLAMVWHEAGRTAEALDLIMRAERVQPGLRGARSRLATAAIDRLQTAWVTGGSMPDSPERLRAREWLDADLAAARDDDATHVLLARLDTIEGNAAAGEARIASRYRESSAMRDGWSALAVMWQGAGDVDRARGLFARDYDAARQTPFVTGRFAALLATEGDIAPARTLIARTYAESAKAQGGYTAIADAMLARIQAAWESGALTAAESVRLAECESLCRQDLDEHRANSSTRPTLARGALLGGRLDEAMALGREHYALTPLSADVFFGLGDLLRRAGRGPEMLEVTAQDFHQGTLSPWATQAWIRALARYGRSEEARGAALADHARLARPAAQVRGALHARDPYTGFDHREHPEDLQGWHSASPAFAELIAAVRPELVIEVGTWKGGSAVHMAKCARHLGLPTTIVCVDTWLGAVEFWLDHGDQERYRALDLRHGFPTVYYQFLANCVHHGVSAQIVPFPQTSSIAALWFAIEGFHADLIYIDASHTYEDVLRDVRSYWEILRPGGVMFGDDFALPDVARAVIEFGQERGLNAQRRDNCWLLRRPA